MTARWALRFRWSSFPSRVQASSPPMSKALAPLYASDPPSPEAAARDIVRQRRHDCERGLDVRDLHVRLRGVEAAYAATLAHEEGATWALRQAFVDVSSCAAELAARLPAPVRPF